MSTIHINAKRGDFATSVILVGDPLRAKYIADHYLDNSHLVTSVRNMLGFTGEFNNRPVSVMGTGMGIASTLIYATELIQQFNVKKLIRVGTCGAIDKNLALGDLIIALGASTDSRVNRLQFSGYDLAAICSAQLFETALHQAKAQALPLRIGNIFSTDLFYHPDSLLLDTLEQFGMLAIEMETAGLYGLAAKFRVDALTVLVASDLLTREEHWTSTQREQGLGKAIEFALNIATSENYK